MILKGSQRGGAAQLARHLLKTVENEHVELYEVRGFVSDDLPGALHEAYAISRGTRCRQFLFSLSLSPPPSERVPVEVFESAIDEAEGRLGLKDQPRVVIFHEKEGRRHAHCVWSRIDPDKMDTSIYRVRAALAVGAMATTVRSLSAWHRRSWRCGEGLGIR